MFGIENISIFIIAALVILIIPGPAILYIIARSLEQGRRAGLVAVCGISCATLVHALAAALGLSAILVSSAIMFNIVKYLGAAYLIYLGIKTIISKTHFEFKTSSRQRSLRRLFSEGFVVNLLNPKTALFFFAFLPQFINPHSNNVAAQFFILGCIMALLGLISDGAWAIFAGSVSVWLKRSSRALVLQKNMTGIVLIGLGLTAALTDTRN